MTRLALVSVILVAFCPLASQDAPAPKGGQVVQLWPPGFLPAPAADAQEKVAVDAKGGGKVTRITNVTIPIITVCRPAGADKPCPAVVVCPGGGYNILAYDLEGTEIVEWLNSLGVAGVLLKYRVPKQRDAALLDAQRALGLVRARAKEWNIDPNRIGIMGFSAGGHLAARLSTNYQKRAYETVDASDQASCRPDFAILIYPAYLTTADDSAVDAMTLPITAETPGTFLAVACKDKFAPGSLQYFLALRKAKVAAELHVYQFGGHGCGLRPTDENVTTWPKQCERWLRGMKILP